VKIDWPMILHHRAVLTNDRDAAFDRGEHARVHKLQVQLDAMPHPKWASEVWNDDCRDKAHREQELMERRRMLAKNDE